MKWTAQGKFYFPNYNWPPHDNQLMSSSKGQFTKRLLTLRNGLWESNFHVWMDYKTRKSSRMPKYVDISSHSQWSNINCETCQGSVSNGDSFSPPEVRNVVQSNLAKQCSCLWWKKNQQTKCINAGVTLARLLATTTHVGQLQIEETALFLRVNEKLLKKFLLPQRWSLSSLTAVWRHCSVYFTLSKLYAETHICNVVLNMSIKWVIKLTEQSLFTFLIKHRNLCITKAAQIILYSFLKR